jgi:hypothetical protein
MCDLHVYRHVIQPTAALLFLVQSDMVYLVPLFDVHISPVFISEHAGVAAAVCRLLFRRCWVLNIRCPDFAVLVGSYIRTVKYVMTASFQILTCLTLMMSYLTLCS